MTKSESVKLPISLVQPSWPGLEGIRSLVIFGDSYSSPPDIESESEEGSEKWVDHLVKNMKASSLSSCPRIYNHAISGTTVSDDLSFELQQFFSAFPKKVSPPSEPSLSPEETLYVLWMGINDCGKASTDELEDVVDTLFDVIHELYVKASARNFLLVDVPPLDRCPDALDKTIDLKETCDIWNDLLSSHTHTFYAETSQATVFLFSAHAVLAELFDNPAVFGFDERDVEEEDGRVWVDDIHLTSAVHSIIAEHLQKTLNSQAPSISDRVQVPGRVVT